MVVNLLMLDKLIMNRKNYMFLKDFVLFHSSKIFNQNSHFQIISETTYPVKVLQLPIVSYTAWSTDLYPIPGA